MYHMYRVTFYCVMLYHPPGSPPPWVPTGSINTSYDRHTVSAGIVHTIVIRCPRGPLDRYTVPAGIMPLHAIVIRSPYA